MLAIGIDPGSANPGYAEVERVGPRWRLLRLPVLSSSDDLCQVMLDQMHQPAPVSIVAIEATDFLFRKEQAHGFVKMRECHGMARLFSRYLSVPLMEIRPVTWHKTITGSTRGTKQQARKVLRAMFENWPDAEVSLHRSDAVAIAVTAMMGMRAETALAGFERLHGV